MARPRKNGSSGTLDGSVTAESQDTGVKRENVPPATMAAEGTVPRVAGEWWAFPWHLPPELRFAGTGEPQREPCEYRILDGKPVSTDELRAWAENELFVEALERVDGHDGSGERIFWERLAAIHVARRRKKWREREKAGLPWCDSKEREVLVNRRVSAMWDNELQRWPMQATQDAAVPPDRPPALERADDVTDEEVLLLLGRKASPHDHHAFREVKEHALKTAYPTISEREGAIVKRMMDIEELEGAPNFRKLGEALADGSEGYDWLVMDMQERLEELGRPADDLQPEEVARALVSFLGTDALRYLGLCGFGIRCAMSAGSWDGSVFATSRARQIGLGRAFAGAPPFGNAAQPSVNLPREVSGCSKDWVTWVPGRAEPSTRRDSAAAVGRRIRTLHDFQEAALMRIREALGGLPSRGWLSLPTGAGKTFVTVEALAGALTNGSLVSAIWLAQTDELCEQAVEAWEEFWAARGDARSLQLVRMWGGRCGPIQEGVPTVVVTTNHSLRRRLEPGHPLRPALREAGALVVDESHHSIAPTYTECLRELGLTPQTTERHLIGLSATPFRSSMESSETSWLAQRYHRNRYGRDLFPGGDPYGYLQERGVLSRVDHRLIEGVEVELDEEDDESLEKRESLPWLPRKAEERLSRSSVRNENILQAVLALPPTVQVIVFAISVEHAEALAARFRENGREAGAISGKTDRIVRREAIERFRSGAMRILTNYRVLATGFDAPKVDVVCIARPTLSRVLYQQMIGRGLRGPLNGGTERCLIMNVKDNLGRFGDRIAFKHFEHLWNR